MPNASRLQGLSAALAELYAPGLDASNYVDRVFGLTARLVPLALNAQGVLNVATGALNANFDRQPPGLGSAFAAFGRLMHKYAPFRFDPTTNGGRPFSARDFFSRRAFHDLDIYQEVYGPMGYEDHCFVHVRAEPGTTVFIGLFRDDGAFDQTDKDLLTLLQPHLVNARRLALAVSAAHDVPVAPEHFEGAGFTPRESDVIYWLTMGKSNEEIGKLLRIRADSVSRHLQAIYEKMGVDHRVAATVHALALARAAQAQALRLNGGAVGLRTATR